jgi:hypothetical protein
MDKNLTEVDAASCLIPIIEGADHQFLVTDSSHEAAGLAWDFLAETMYSEDRVRMHVVGDMGCNRSII